MFRTVVTPPSINQAMIDHYVARGKAARSRAIVAMVKRLFSTPRRHPKAQAGCAA